MKTFPLLLWLGFGSLALGVIFGSPSAAEARGLALAALCGGAAAYIVGAERLCRDLLNVAALAFGIGLLIAPVASMLGAMSASPSVRALAVLTCGLIFAAVGVLCAASVAAALDGDATAPIRPRLLRRAPDHGLAPLEAEEGGQDWDAAPPASADDLGLFTGGGS